MPAPKSSRPRYEAAAARLREWYAQRGELRVPDYTRRRKEGWRRYKHGHELRFKTYVPAELAEILPLLRTVGIQTGRPYAASSYGKAVPIYGKERVLSAIRTLRLRKPRGRTRNFIALTPFVPPRLAFTTFRQLDVAMLMYDRGPLTVGELKTTGALLAGMAKHRLVRPLTNRSGVGTTWILTFWGKEQTRRGRRAWLDWIRSGKRGNLLKP